jgi:cytochrome P450
LWHPLARYPGPLLWRAFRLPYALNLWKGEYVHRISEMHKIYGDIVRVAPNELSFIDVQAWQDIYCPRPGHKPFPKNPIWWGDYPGRTPSIVSTPSWDAHERMRKLLLHCFSSKALRGQETSVRHHTNLLISQLNKQAAGSGKTVVNIVDWYMFLTFDILGDLAFGESFNCIETEKLHPWIMTIFNYFRIAAFIGILRLYTMKNIDSVLMKIAPRKSVEMSKANYQWAVDKVHRRMNLDTPRDDFMTYILSANNDVPEKKAGMSIAEIENNGNVLVVAGSETCGTVLSGTTNYLLKSQHAYDKLAREIRTFEDDESLTFQTLATLPYLNAVIEEGLRLCPPSASGLQHIVPDSGDTVCGQYLPAGVSSKKEPFLMKKKNTNLSDRQMCLSTNGL